jgi:hypothetical protein
VELRSALESLKDPTGPPAVTWRLEMEDVLQCLTMFNRLTMIICYYYQHLSTFINIYQHLLTFINIYQQ